MQKKDPWCFRLFDQSELFSLRNSKEPMGPALDRLNAIRRTLRTLKHHPLPFYQPLHLPALMLVIIREKLESLTACGCHTIFGETVAGQGRGAKKRH